MTARSQLQLLHHKIVDRRRPENDNGVHPVPTMRETLITAIVVLLIVAVMVLMSIYGITSNINNLSTGLLPIIAAIFGLIVAAGLFCFAIYIVVRTAFKKIEARHAKMTK